MAIFVLLSIPATVARWGEELETNEYFEVKLQ